MEMKNKNKCQQIGKKRAANSAQQQNPRSNYINVSSSEVGLLQVHSSAVAVDFVITSFASITSIFRIVFGNTRFLQPV